MELNKTFVCQFCNAEVAPRSIKARSRMIKGNLIWWTCLCDRKECLDPTDEQIYGSFKQYNPYGDLPINKPI